MSYLANLLKKHLEERNLTYELRENYLNYKNNEPSIIEPINYKISLSEIRPQIINWIIFLCDNLNFSIETLFRCVIIFDQYIGKVKKEKFNENNILLIAIASLSLATKIEEINCNYIKFLTDKVLNSPVNKKYTYKDLSKMEFEILKTINFKILYSTPIHFGKIFFELLKKTLLLNENILINLWNSYEFYLKNILINEMYITMLQSDIAYYCFVECCNDNGLNNNIIRKIYNIINYTEKEEPVTKNNFYNMIAIRSL
jgi:hypothetical protein